MTSSPQPVDVEVGRRIFALRRRRGLSRRVLAEAAGVTFQQIQKYEAGVNRVSSSRLAAIAACLGISTSALFGESADPRQRDDEAAKLLEAFNTIDDPEQRRSLLLVVRTMARSIRRGV